MPVNGPSRDPRTYLPVAISATAAPRKSFYYGFRYPSQRFAIASSQLHNDLRIDVVDSAGQVVRTFYRNDVAPNTETRIRWDGTKADGRPSANGRYSFRIGPPASATSRTSDFGTPFIEAEHT